MTNVLIVTRRNGELMSGIFNPTPNAIVIPDGTKFAQIYDPTTMNRPLTTRAESLAETSRGSGGFGSTATELAT